jgi:alanine racemase
VKKLIIQTADLAYNINRIQKLCAGSRIIGVLKGNGYGLGIVPFARLCMENGVDFFAVSELEEAKTLREAGFQNEILLLTPTCDVRQAQLIAQLEITATVGSLESAKALNEIGIPVKAHIKLDTGFGRFGFDCEGLDQVAEQLKQFENITYSGVFSHFSNSFGKDVARVQRQFERFMVGVDRLKMYGITPGMRHICNSCGALRFPQMRLDAVRIGSAFLGRLPLTHNYRLKRIAQLQCEIADIRTLPPGSNVGYADTYTTKRETKIGVVQVGYKDGFGVEKSKDTFRFMDILRYIYGDMRSFHKRLFATVHGQVVPLIGRVSMYNIVLDLTDVKAEIGDTVTLECNPILIDSSIKREYI